MAVRYQPSSATRRVAEAVIDDWENDDGDGYGDVGVSSNGPADHVHATDGDAAKRGIEANAGTMAPVGTTSTTGGLALATPHIKPPLIAVRPSPSSASSASPIRLLSSGSGGGGSGNAGTSSSASPSSSSTSSPSPFTPGRTLPTSVLPPSLDGFGSAPQILRRSDAGSRNTRASGSASPSFSAAAVQRKTLAEREKEYEEARRRIFGQQASTPAPSAAGAGSTASSEGGSPSGPPAGTTADGSVDKRRRRKGQGQQQQRAPAGGRRANGAGSTRNSGDGIGTGYVTGSGGEASTATPSRASRETRAPKDAESGPGRPRRVGPRSNAQGSQDGTNPAKAGSPHVRRQEQGPLDLPPQPGTGTVTERSKDRRRPTQARQGGDTAPRLGTQVDLDLASALGDASLGGADAGDQ